MNKKISILTIIFSGILSIGAFADNKIDASDREGKTLTLDGSGLANIQGYLNTAANPILPGTTPSEGLVGTSESSRTKESTIEGQKELGHTWGTTTAGENFYYKAKINNNPNISEISNCNKDGTYNRCKFDSTIKSATLKTVTRAGNNGYLTLDNTEPSVIFTPDGKQYFYKFWQSVDKSKYTNCCDSAHAGNCGNLTKVKITNETPCECEMGRDLGGCWSPLYPMISYQKGSSYPSFDSDKTEIENMIKGGYSKTVEDKVRNFYGPRDIEKNENAYANNISEGQDAYRMKVKVAAHKENGVQTGTIHKNANAIDTKNKNPNEVGADAIVSVKSWTVKNNKLDPDFNYASMGPNRVLQNSKFIDTSDLDLVANVSSESTNNVLPCGMFYDTDSVPNGYYYKNKGVECRQDGKAIRQSRHDSDTDDGAKAGEQMYTYYHVALPNGPNSYEPTFTHKLKYRACAVCKPLDKKYCKKIVQEYINRGTKRVGDLIAALRNNNNAIDVGIFESQTRPSNNKPDLLKGSNASSDYQYSGTMTCSTCLQHLDEILTESDIISKLTE